MLGAQARAAELQAAKSAALRQKAHQEAEEQSIPAQSTPVLLTDFVRNPLLSKNKGTKAFRPLIDSDLEAPERQADLASDSSALESFATVTPLEQSDQISSPQELPTAPRAMRAQARFNPFNPAATLFSSRDQHLQAQRTSLNKYEDPIMLSPTVKVTPHTRTIFGPDDLSPIKQEIKFTEMRQLYASVQHHPTLLTHDARPFTSQEGHLQKAQSQHQDVHTQLPFDPYMFSRPQVAHYQSESGTSSTGIFLNQTHLERTRSFADDVMNHQTELQQQTRARSPSKLAQPALENEQPYDRNSKMQSFVAAQQAMARKGKTVLHNPDLYRSSPLAETKTPLSMTSSAGMPSPLQICAGMSALNSNDESGVSIMSTNKTRKEESTSCSSEKWRNAVQILDSPAICVGNNGVVPLRQEEWCTLRPITTDEREKMLRIMRDAAAESTICADTVPFTRKTSVIGPAAQKWVTNETVDVSRRQSALKGIVDEYHRYVDVVSTYGAIGRPLLREKLTDIRQGPLKPVANIMAMLHHFADERRLNPENKEYTAAPGYAINRNAGIEPFGVSLFDDHTVASARL